jgi:FtsP/CotA-like multicopper oxidase with cupredoxin domain
VLRITEGGIDIDGKKGQAYGIRQADGTVGYVGTKGQQFKVVLQNHTTEPLAIHWHGLILPDGQDGVPYVTQVPIKPGEERRYDFPIVQAGTYWMHSHFGLQEQGMMTAPLILNDPADPRRGEQDVVMLLNDFTVRDPATILAELQGQTPKAEAGGTRQMAGGAEQGMSGMAMGGKTPGMDKADLSDVKYEALLSTVAPFRILRWCASGPDRPSVCASSPPPARLISSSTPAGSTRKRSPSTVRRSSRSWGVALSSPWRSASTCV